jgi:transcription initiation factor IIE alpha subunit
MASKPLQEILLTRNNADSMRFEMHATPVLQYLKKHGQLLDSEIAAATGIPLPKVRISLSDLLARGEISSCSVIRFNDGKPVEGMLCRISGYIPPAAPGRKPGS